MFQKQFQQGNFGDAYAGSRQLCLDPKTDANQVPNDLNLAVECLKRLGRIAEVDELLESTVKAHSRNWRLLQAAAQQYQSLQHEGFIIAGKFERGPHRGGGKMAHAFQRDRVRALQLLSQALPLAQADDRKEEVGDFLFRLANTILQTGMGPAAWRLQHLTDLSVLPDYEEGYPFFAAPEGAPVDAQGNPVLHTVPKSWEAAQSDGQRWRWALAQAAENAPRRTNEMRWHLAQFLQEQFGVQTIRQGFFVRGFGAPDDREDRKDESGTYALHTLGEDETIARLATGIKRFRLPDEFNFIRILQEIAKEPQMGYGENALNTLAQIFENRRQYDKAAEYWRQTIKLHGAGTNGWKQKRLDQIVANWGRFEPVMSQPAGRGATLEFIFRNAKQAEFEAQEIDVARLLDDVKAYLKGNPPQIDGSKIQVEDLGWRLVQANETRYLGQRVASWTEKLEPRENHFDRRVTITTPLRKAGVYLVTARVQGGNVSKIVVWVADTAIVNKQLSGQNYYFVGDAVTGAPVAGANVEFFGFRPQQTAGRRFVVLTKNFAELTDRNGQVLPANSALSNEYQWLVIARTPQGRLAHLGFRGVWVGQYYDAEYNEVKAFCITDRPVYRPDQTVHFKFWVRQAQYDQEDVSRFAGQTFVVELTNPKGEKVQTWNLKADAYAGMEGTYEIPKGATLGPYQLQVQNHGGGSFRVEEYKKPEFEVTVEAPTDPVMLGEKITAKIQAKYYFGSPVTKASVKYKVLRSDYSQDWYPVAPWDWFYGPGYWWFVYDYPWYPGWRDWAGCLRPVGWWWPRGFHPPEVVAEQEVEIGDDGLVNVEIDTAIAKALHGDSDHEYTITAEVRDQSRRTIVGQGKVLVARKPFKVFSWVDRGYYRVGDTVQASFLAQTLARKPVQGKGTLTLYKVTYGQDNQPIEAPVQTWNLNTNEEGRAQQQLQASEKGIYRLSMAVTDAQQHKIEGGYLFTVIGEGFDGRQYRFNSVELIPDQREYQTGDRVKLQVNTEKAGSTVLLFVRPANGIYLAPQILRIQGKTTVQEIGVVKKDMPNFFVEAVTIADGKVHSEVKEIVVPPEKRVLNVEVLPSEKTFKPKQKATVKVHVTDFYGKNFVGSTVLSIYDKSVEYISGGSNVPEIREFFWKWRRHHHPQQQTSLDRHSGNLVLRNQAAMSPIGVFGDTVADEMNELARRASGGRGPMALGNGMGGGGMRGARMAMPGGMAADRMAVAESPMPAMAAMDGAAGMAMPMAAKAEGEAGAGAPGMPAASDLVTPTIRSEFADTALWVGSLTTDKNGMAEVSLDMPENLTAWKVRVWGMGHGTKVGSGDAEIVTRKDLIVRLQAPRFLVQKDEVVLSANIHNYLASDKTVKAVLELPSEEIEPLGPRAVNVTVPANGEKRVDWRARVLREGQATVRMLALTDEESDAMEVKVPCFVHGILKTESWAGTVRPDQPAANISITVPSQRRVEQSRLEIRYSPTLAGAMVDALPYLIEYPYGCTEQTLNRFLPSVITQKVLLELRVNLNEVRDKRTNLNTQEIGDDRQRSKQWKRFDRNPVFDQDELSRIVKEGVTALTEMQVSDGGWGWFSGWGERSYPHTTALVVHGLQIAQQNDVALVPGVLERGVEWLKRYQAEQLRMLNNAPKRIDPRKERADNLDALVYMVLADAGAEERPMREFLYRDRNDLAVYSKAMFGLALHKLGDREKLSMILQNIGQFLVQDAENETAYLRLPGDQYWWYWYGSEIEANAYYLKLLAQTDAKGITAPRLVKYLLNNRKHGTYWNSTRDTAVCVEAFADYVRATGEMQPQMVVEVWIDGQKRKEVEITAKDLFTFDNKFVLAGADVSDGRHVVELRRRGRGPVYFNAYLTNFTLEDPITKAGLEVKVQRKVYKLQPVDKTIQAAGSRGQVLNQKVEKYQRLPLENLSQLKSGDLVEIELEIESKNDYEYLMFEDMKAAGFEPVEVRSGYSANGLGAYMELRDERVTFFVQRLARGQHSVAYRLRAETPGQFSALPALGQAMYAPELRGNSDEIKLRIVD